MINRKSNQLWAPLTSTALALILLESSGCTYYMPAAVSSTSVGNQGEIPIKVVSGSSSANSFLFFGPFGDASLQAALEDARRQGDGDTLANVFVDRKLICFPACFLPIYSSIETRITGTLIKYQDERSRQFQSAPAKQAPIADSSKINIAAKAAYDQMLASFGQGQLAAETVYTSFSARTRNDLKQYVLTQYGSTSAWSWKLTIPANTPENEKRFLHWYVKTYTDYKPTE